MFARWALRGLAALGLLLVFVVSLATAVVLHLNTRVTRRAMATIVSKVASGSLRGSVEIKEIRHIGLDGIDIARAELRDPSGRLVLAVIDAKASMRALVLAKQRILDHVVVGRIEVNLIDDGTGQPSLVDAVLPKKPSPPDTPSSPPPKFAITSIDLDAIAVRGALGTRPISLDLAVHGLAIALGPEGTKVSLAKLDALAGPGNGLPEPVSIEVKNISLDQGSAKGSAMNVLNVVVDVKSGGATAEIQGRYAAAQIDVHVKAAAASADLSRWLAMPAGTPQKPSLPEALGIVTAQVHAQGTIDAIAIDGDVGTSMGGLKFVGKAAPIAMTGELTLDADAIDVHRMVPGVPAGLFDLHAQLESKAVGTDLAIALGGSGAPRDPKSAGLIGNTKLSFSANAVVPSANLGQPKSGHVHVLVARDGTEVLVDADLKKPVTAPKGDGSCCLVAFSVKGKTGPLDALPHELTGGPIVGSALFHASGEVDLAKETIDANASVDVARLQKGTLCVAGVHATAIAKGSLSKPNVSAGVQLARAELLDAKTAAPTASLTGLDAHATLSGDTIHASVSFDTDRGQHLGLSASIDHDPAGNVTIRQLSAKIERKKFVGLLTAKRIAMVGKRVTVDGLRLASTAGGIRFDGVVSLLGIPESIDLATTDLDVGLLAFGLGVQRPPYRGKVRLTAKVKHGGPGAPRAFVGSIEIAAKGTVRTPDRGHVPIDLNGTFTLDPLQAAASMQLQIADVVKIDLAGHANAVRDDFRSFLTSPGQVDVTIADVDLARVLSFARSVVPSKPIAPGLDVSGVATIELHVARPTAGAMPTVLLDVHGSKLQIQNEKLALGPLDLQTHVDATPSEAEMKIGASAKLADENGALMSFDASASLADAMVTSALAGQLTLSNIVDLPLEAHVVVPKRVLAKLPEALRAQLPARATTKKGAPTTTSLDADLTWKGPLSKPTVALDLHLLDIDLGADGSFGLTSHVTYDGKVAQLHAELAKPKHPAPLTLDANVQVALLDALKAQPQKGLAWTAGLDVHAHAVPLAFFPAVADQDIDGMLACELHLAHVHDPAVTSPEVKFDAELSALSVNHVSFDSVHLSADIGAVQAAVSIKATGQGGVARIDGRVPLLWTDALVPSVKPASDVTVTAYLKGLRLGAFATWVPGLDELDGRLDADLTATVALPNGKSALSVIPKGTLSLHEGILNVAAIGQRWEQVEAEVALSADKMELKKLVLHGRGGVGKAEMSASIDLEKQIPKTLHAQIDTKRFAIATDGVPIGDLSGTIKIDGSLDGAMPKLVAVIDPMTVDLAASSGKSPQALDDEPSIYVEQPLGPPKAPIEQSKSSAFAMELRIKMPNNVWVRRDDLQVALRGGPTIILGATPSYRGEVTVDRGRVDVFGKRFEITRARVSFDGAADLDPALDIESTWTAPDDTIVTVTIGGRMNTPKLTLSASPAATDAQIVNLLALGRRDSGTSTTDTQGGKMSADAQGAALAGAMTSAVLGGQLQHALPTNVSISIRPGQTGLADGSVAGGYQWKRVYFEVGYDAGAVNAPPGAITPSTTTAKVEWRIFSHWSLMATLGDTGSSIIDLIWHIKY